MKNVPDLVTSRGDGRNQGAEMATIEGLLFGALEDLSQKERKDFKFHLRQPYNDFCRIPQNRLEGTDESEIAKLMVQHYNEQAVDVAKSILGRILRNDLVEDLTNKISEQTGPEPQENIQKHQQKLRSHLKGIFTRAREGMSERTDEQNLAMVFTELYVTSGCEMHKQHEIIQIQMDRGGTEEPIKPSDIFKDPAGIPTRTVVTTGVAGIGKTFLVRKFVLDWAEGTNNEDIHLLFPLNFRELNLLKERRFSLAELIHASIWESKAITERELNHIFTQLQTSGNRDYKSSEIKILFVLDGLDESRLHLDCARGKKQTVDFDVTQPTSVDVLLTALIKGDLLPPARIWITTRPAAADHISRDFVDRMTVVRGFTDPLKVEYFKKKFPDETQAERVISHIKASRSLFSMCYIPIFCWLIACVFKDVLKARKKTELPKTLTEMYTEFIAYQITKTGEKCGLKKGIKYIQSLAKLAFHQLEKQDPIFYEKDLKDSGINFHKAALYCGVFTEVFEEVRKWKLDDDKGRMFSFVHLSLQEYLAALHVVMSLINNNRNVLSEPTLNVESLCTLCRRKSLQDVHEIALNRALQNPKGQLDLFLRFLLGLSLETNQNLLKRLLKLKKDDTHINNKIIKSIKEKLRQDICPERSINLFHCLNELKDESLLEEIQQYLHAGSLSSGNLSSTQWSALVFILLSSNDDLDVFDLKKYSASAEGLQRLLPVVKVSKKLLLNNCNLTEKSCEALASVLSSQPSSIRELDLSDNDLCDSGVKLLSEGLASPHCTLQSLKLSGCMITQEGCSYLASALKSNPSNLKELDLSYNHPGDRGAALLSDGLDPQCTLNLDHGGEQRLKPGVKKYICELKLDQNTAHRNLKLSDDCTKVTVTEEQQWHPHHLERFDCWRQVLCSTGLIGRCYWEVEWREKAYIAVTYRKIRRRGEGTDGCLGANDHSWMLLCDEHGFSVRHEDRDRVIDRRLTFESNRVAVYLDYLAGILSFYKVFSGTLVLLHTFESTFTEPLYPAFGFGLGYGFEYFGSSVSLCEVEDVQVSSNC
ncbi:NACHT, LRR and PYD domains-containing protein 3-like isoform X2 [Parambassis ranga]|nr:NACHT, LRR and PYD domains-containing protein 3-like isoform X2 [Parambassis ranga]